MTGDYFGGAQRGALAGLKVVELGYAASVPALCRMLAALGAIVVKVESELRPELMRPAPTVDGKPSGACYPEFAAGKRHVAINLKDAEGLQVMRALLRWADVFAENCRPGVVEEFQLDYAHLKMDNPGLLMVSVPALGRGGPRESFRAYGVTAQAYAGINAITGYEDGEAMNPGISFPDPLACLSALIAINAGLIERRRSGRGQFIEVSLVDAAMAVLGPALLDASINGRPQEPRGNRHAFAAPHGAYRCQGEDRWLALACFDQDQWESLVSAMANPDWAADDAYRTPLSRWGHQNDLDRHIERWTLRHEAEALVSTLGAAGVPSGLVATTADLLRDRHLAARRYFMESRWAPYQPLPPYPTFPVPIRFSKTPVLFGQPSALGADNRHVFVELLGMPVEEFQRLTENGALS